MVAAAAAPQGARRAAVATEEERRRNRMTSNRLSARKSRMKRQQHVDDLTAEAERLRRENEAMRAGAGEALRRGRALEQENRVLAAHARQLCAALLLRNSQLRLLGGTPGTSSGTPARIRCRPCRWRLRRPCNCRWRSRCCCSLTSWTPSVCSCECSAVLPVIYFRALLFVR